MDVFQIKQGREQLKKIIVMLSLVTMCLSCVNKSENTNHSERHLNGVDLESSQNEITTRYKSGFSKCRPSGNKIACFWEGGDGPIQMLYFVNEKITSGVLSMEKLPLSEVINSLKSQKLKFTVEPIKMGVPVDEGTLQAIKHGDTKVLDGPDKVKVGDYLSFGCEVVVPHYNGHVKYMGLKKDFQIRECSDDTISALSANSIHYYDKNYVD